MVVLVAPAKLLNVAASRPAPLTAGTATGMDVEGLPGVTGAGVGLEAPVGAGAGVVPV